MRFSSSILLRFLLLPLLSFYFLTILHGQSNNKINFTTINNTNGLPNNNINDIVKDRFGFVWIATNDGLCRYESSNHVKIYKANDPSIPTGLKSSNIRTLCVDSHDNLWIGTTLGGLTRFHQPSNTWTTFLPDKDDPNSISNNEILVIMEDRKGQLWIGTENGLNVFHPETGTFTSFLATANTPNTLHAKAVLSIMEDDKGYIWVGTWSGGMYLMMPPENGQIEDTAFRKFEPSNRGLSNNVWKIYQDKEKRFWVGTNGGGLFHMTLPKNYNNNITRQKWSPTFQKVLRSEKAKNTISSDIVQEIFQDESGALWVGTSNGLNYTSAKNIRYALNKMHTNTELDLSFQRFAYQPDDPKSITHNNVNGIYQDDQGIMWFSTFSGISQYNWYTNQFDVHELFNHIDKSSDTKNFAIDEKNMLWIGTDQGLMIYDAKTKSKKQFTYNHLLSNAHIVSVHSPDGKNLYLGTKGGVSKLDIENLKVSNYPLPDWIRKKQPDVNITNLHYDSKGRIWVGTRSGLLVINETDKSYLQFLHDAQQTNSISDNSINSIFEDQQQNIWITTYNGLNLVKNNTLTNDISFTTFKHDPENPIYSIPSNRLTCMEEVNDVLYIGTVSGLCSYDVASGQFKDLSKGERKYCFQSLEKTQDGNLWASTTEGIIYYDVDKHSFNKFEKADGLGDITFRTGCSSRDDEGYFYFGSRRGITRFHPDKIVGNRSFPPVYITDIKLMSPNGVKEISGIFEDKLTLNHDDYFLSLDFAALNYNRSEKNKYAYRLIGFDKEWVYDNQSRSAVYTNLDAGEYQFHVKAANNDGLWNTIGKTIYITVKPAFWETGWFIGTCILALGSSIYFIFILYTRNVHSRNQILKQYNSNLNNEITERKKVEAALQEREQHMERLVVERTKQLADKNEEVKELLAKLTLRNEELENMVAQRTKSLRNTNQELMRSNKDLEQFAYIASHDLQEPLRTIGSFVGLIGKLYIKELPEDAKQYIQFAEDGVQRMSQLIKSLLTYSRIGKESTSFKMVNLNFLLGQKIMDLSKKIEDRNVVIEMEYLPEIHCERNQLGMVFYNLVNNAIKFNDSPTPVIQINHHENAPDGFWKFSVKDNGIGIEEKNQKKIFEIFSRLNGKQYEGTGIGLALCQKVLHAHGGDIWLESKKGEGTTFFLTVSKELHKQQNSKFAYTAEF